MPKQYIYSERVMMNETTGEESLANPNRVKVTWNKETGDIQIATINPETEYDHNEKSGWYVDLERAHVNDLIRTLRRARDTALGRDE